MANKEIMIETNSKYCSKCKWSAPINGSYSSVTCDRYLLTGLKRECPVGYCDKFEKETKEFKAEKRRLQHEYQGKCLKVKRDDYVVGNFDHSKWDVRRERYEK